MVLRINREAPFPLSDDQRLNVSYYRTSTNSQDEEMQIAAAHSLMQQMGLSNVLELNEHGVSANTVPLRQRQKLNILLNLIKEGRVNHLLVFARDRLARDPYEYNEIQKTIRKHGVKIIFTMENAVPFQEDEGMELLLSVFARYEGQQIRQRTYETSKQFPPRIFGYHKMVENGTKRYVVDESKESDIVRMFRECSEICSPEDFAFFLVKYQKLFKRHPLQILNMLQNPFYSAHLKHGNQYLQLDHVEPMITFDLFNKAEKVVLLYKRAISEALLKQQFLLPKCAICNSTMKIIGRNLIDPGSFVCSNNHTRVAISVDELEEEARNVIDSFIASISVKSIEVLTKKSLNKLLSQLETELKKQRTVISNAYIQTCLKYSPTDDGPSLTNQIQHLEEMEKKHSEYLVKRNRIQIALQETQQLVDLLHKSSKETLGSIDFQQLIKLLFESVRVSNDSLIFSLYFGDLVRGLNYE